MAPDADSGTGGSSSTALTSGPRVRDGGGETATVRQFPAPAADLPSDAVASAPAVAAADAEDEVRSKEARLTAARLGAAGVVATALTWVDNAGIARTKGVPVARLSEAAVHGVGAAPCFDVFTADDAITEGRLNGGPVGDLRLVPDLARAVPLAAQPGWAWAPADRHRQDGTVHPGCQRSFLRRMTERAAERGLVLRSAYEIEWIVQREDGRYPTDGPAYGMQRLTDLSDYLRDVLEALAAQGLTVQQIHPEYAPGQFEVSVAAEDPLGAADTSVLVRHTVRGVAARHGLRAAFGPVFEPDGVGNGQHLHLSVWRGTGADAGEGAGAENLFAGGPGRHGLTADGEAFLAGVLAELPGLVALGAASAASYLRLVPAHWSGAFACWGLENREAALRLIAGPPEAANAEVKCLDASGNPYLVLGGVIAAGLAGMDAGLRLPEETTGEPSAAAVPPERLPGSVEEARRALAGSAVLGAALGPELADAVDAVRRAEAARYAGAAVEGLIAASRWRY